MFPTKTECVVLELLIGSEKYGLELVHHSGGRLKRGTVYVLLDRLESKNFIQSREVEEGKRRYRVTGEGKRAYLALQNAQCIMGFREALV